MSTMPNTLGARIDFLFEKWSERYKRYSKANIAKEKSILAQETLQSNLLCKLAGKGGV